MNEAPQPPAPQLPEPPRVLRRSSSDKVIAGVCGGLGRYLGVDPILLRIAFVVLAVSGGGGLLLYVIAWIAIPEEKPGEELGSKAPDARTTARIVIGGTLIAVGAVLLLNLSIPEFGKYFWPLALVAVGVGIVVQASARR